MSTTILNFILVAITSLAITPFMTAMIKRFSNEESIFSKDLFKELKFDWKVSLITPVIIIALFYYYGVSLTFFLYSFLTIIIVMEAFVDIKAQILPNLLNFIGFIVGIIYAYFVSLTNIVAGWNLILGLVVGAGIFLLIAGFALVVYKREGMGLGDVKLMGVLGLFFGALNTIQIFVVSFFVAAIISIILLATRIKKTTDYIAFGPFIVIATVFTMFVPVSQSMEYLSILLNR